MIIGVDPGMSGAMAWRSDSGRIGTLKMCETLQDLAQWFRGCVENSLTVFVWLEKVGTYMPGNSGPSAAKFARHVGNLEGILAGLQMPYDYVRPAEWEHWYIGKPNWSKIPKDLADAAQRKVRSDRKRERKNMIKAKGQRLYPELNVTLTTADAVGILEWATALGRETEKGE